MSSGSEKLIVKDLHVAVGGKEILRGVDLEIGQRLLSVETVVPYICKLGFPLGTELNAQVNPRPEVES